LNTQSHYFEKCKYPLTVPELPNLTYASITGLIHTSTPEYGFLDLSSMRPLSTPHLDINHLALEDKDFQIKYTTSPTYHLKLHCWTKDKFLNQNNVINFGNPIYPSVCSQKCTHSLISYISIMLAIFLAKEKLFPLTNNCYSPSLQILLTKWCSSIQALMRLH